MTKTLFLLALIPPPAICEEIRIMKEDMKDRFSASHALKLPAHITLQHPFIVEEEQESLLFSTLEEFAKTQKPFEVELKDFDSFPPRVIFVAIKTHDPLIALHSKLRQALPEAIFQNKNQRQEKIHPHITLATRDLDKALYAKAFEHFSKKEYSARFIINNLTLFRHDGKKWHLSKKFFFSGTLA